MDQLPEAILFDTDNTLYRYEPAHQAALNATACKAATLLNISEKDFIKQYNSARDIIKARIINTASSHSRLLYLQTLLETNGFRSPLHIALDLEQTYWRTFLFNTRLFDGLIDFLDLVASFNIKIAVITDLTASIQLRKLTFFGLENTFDAVVTSEEVGVDKPHRSNFDLALSKLSLSSFDHVWMIGDHPISDVQGSLDVGAYAFQKIHSGVELYKHQHPRYKSFHNYIQLQHYLSNLA
jgi:FMN phosphatase YigB (HAD superfamily)